MKKEKYKEQEKKSMVRWIQGNYWEKNLQNY